MGTTSEFLKLRAKNNPKVGQWNKDYKSALALAKKENKFIITAWSNGDNCSLCVVAEKCMMQATFKNWMKTADAYFAFQCSADSDKGQTLHNWIFKSGGINQYPGFRITLYNAKGEIVVDKAITGNSLRGNSTGAAGAKTMIANLQKILDKKPADQTPTPEPVAQDYVVRLNEALTTAQVNKILNALDKNNGYCPCQAKADGTKCHCEDFVKNKDYGVPCICKIYVKQKPVTSK